MVFLMRDWQHAEKYDFGCDVSEGGYLDEVLKINKHQSDARKTLKKSFGDMSCFFLPHPGKKVAETRKGQKPFQGALGGMNIHFSLDESIFPEIFRAFPLLILTLHILEITSFTIPF